MATLANSMMERRFKSVLRNVDTNKHPDYQILLVTKDVAVTWGQQALARLSREEQKEADVMVSEIGYIPVCEIHVASTQVEGEPLKFAIADLTKAQSAGG